MTCERCDKLEASLQKSVDKTVDCLDLLRSAQCPHFHISIMEVDPVEHIKRHRDRCTWCQRREKVLGRGA